METRISLGNGKTVIVDDPSGYLLEQILKKKEKIGEYPTLLQILADKEMPTQTQYAFYFGSYENAVVAAKALERKKQGLPPKAAIKTKYISFQKKE